MLQQGHQTNKLLYGMFKLEIKLEIFKHCQELLEALNLTVQVHSFTLEMIEES